MSRPLFSIVTGTRNRPRSLERLVASVLTHTAEPFELLIGDASDDVPRYRSTDPRVQVFEEHQPLGYVRGYNALFRKARGRYVCFLNDDLEVLPGWSAAIASVLERDREVDLACVPLIEPDEDGGILLLYRGIPYACMGAVRREAGEALGWLDEGYRFYGADPDFSLRLIMSGRRLAPVYGRHLLHHRLGDDERAANSGHFDADNERLRGLWKPRIKETRRRYSDTSLCYFKGLDTRWSLSHQTRVLEIPLSPAARPRRLRSPHVEHRPRWSLWG